MLQDQHIDNLYGGGFITYNLVFSFNLITVSNTSSCPGLKLTIFVYISLALVFQEVLLSSEQPGYQPKIYKISSIRVVFYKSYFCRVPRENCGRIFKYFLRPGEIITYICLKGEFHGNAHDHDQTHSFPLFLKQSELKEQVTFVGLLPLKIVFSLQNVASDFGRRPIFILFLFILDETQTNRRGSRHFVCSVKHSHWGNL